MGGLNLGPSLQNGGPAPGGPQQPQNLEQYIRDVVESLLKDRLPRLEAAKPQTAAQVAADWKTFGLEDSDSFLFEVSHGQNTAWAAGSDNYAGYHPFGIRKDASGQVYLRGAISATTIVLSGADPGNENAFILPPGFRPQNDLNLAIPYEESISTLVGDRPAAPPTKTFNTTITSAGVCQLHAAYSVGTTTYHRFAYVLDDITFNTSPSTD